MRNPWTVDTMNAQEPSRRDERGRFFFMGQGKTKNLRDGPGRGTKGVCLSLRSGPPVMVDMQDIFVRKLQRSFDSLAVFYPQLEKRTEAANTS